MANEDKLFEFMTKMYSEMQTGFKSVNTRLDKVDIRFDNVEGEISGIKSDLQKIGTKIDGELIPKQQALFDGYKQNTETLNELKMNIEQVDKKTDILKDSVIEINSSISEMKEDINFIAGKTIRNDSKLEKLNNQLKAVK